MRATFPKMRRSEAMTLLMVIVRPEGVWVSTDYRITLKYPRRSVPGPDQAKQISIHCPSGDGTERLLLGFTGVAEIDGTPTIQWLRETIRGVPRTITRTLDFVRERLDRDVPRDNPGLAIFGGCLAHGQSYAVQIANVRTPDWSRVASTFEWKISERPEPEVFIGGSGVNHVSADDIDLMVKQANIEPREWNNHLGLLAAVNRRTAEREHSREVSPWCQVSYATQENETVTTRLAGERTDRGGDADSDCPQLRRHDRARGAGPTSTPRVPRRCSEGRGVRAFGHSTRVTRRRTPPPRATPAGAVAASLPWRGAQGSLGGAEQPERVGHEDRSRAAPEGGTRSHRRGRSDHAERRGQTMTGYTDTPA